MLQPTKECKHQTANSLVNFTVVSDCCVTLKKK